jgi:antitoxin ParD1/3/4
MPHRNIELSEHLDRFIESEIGSGKFIDANEVVRESLLLLERRSRQNVERLTWLSGAVQVGLSELDRGEGIEFGSLEGLDRYIDEIGEEAGIGN